MPNIGAAGDGVRDDGGVGGRDAGDVARKATRRWCSFYRLVRPAGAGGGRFPRRPASARRPTACRLQLLGWVLGCAFVYATLFGAGSALYGLTTQATVWGVVWLVSGVGLIRILNRHRTAGAIESRGCPSISRNDALRRAPEKEHGVLAYDIKEDAIDVEFTSGWVYHF